MTMASPEKRNSWLITFGRALRISTLGWDLAVPITGAALLGHALKGRYHTGPVVTVTLLLLGVLVGAYNACRQLGVELSRERRVAHQVRRQDGMK
jgi:hypothetical protein